MMGLLATALFLFLSVLTSSGVTHASSYTTREEQEKFLTRFGYMGPNSYPDPRIDSITDVDEVFRMAVMKYQWMSGIDETGVVDAETVKMMKKPRCGNRDMVGMSMIAKRRRRRYAIFGRWPRTDLTYRINNYTSHLHPNVTDSEIQTAFKRWSDVSPLTFVRVADKTETADIEMYFGFVHAALAYAYIPEDGGDVFFNDETEWTSQNISGINLLRVAVHEIGHSLGLDHSNVEGSIMRGYEHRDFDAHLHADDIEGIQYLYGSKMEPSTTDSPSSTTLPSDPSVTKVPPSSHSICHSPSVDAIFAVNEDVYIFKGSEYYMGHRRRFLTPAKPISDWPDLPDNIDTAVYLGGSIIFFKGQNFWRYNNAREPEGSNPQSISSVFTGLPDQIDVAFVWSGNGKLYFISGDEYYRMSKNRSAYSYRVDRAYPQPLRMWKGLPSKIDAAFNYTNSRTYFFSEFNFYRFNDVKFKVDSGYPKSTAEYWLGCSDQSLASDLKTSEEDVMEKEWMAGGD